MQTTLIILCESCGRPMRIPADKGSLHVTCPRCKHSFDADPAGPSRRNRGFAAAVTKPLPPDINALRVHPLSITHILMIVDNSSPLRTVAPGEIYSLWSSFNTEMAEVLEVANVGIPVYYIEAQRYFAGTKDVDPKHLMGEHLHRLGVPLEHSVAVQLLSIEFEGSIQNVTLETVFRTEKAQCIISEQPLQPYVG